MQLPNGSGWPWRWNEERKTRLEKMVATAQLMLSLIKGVVNVGVVLSLKLIWQLFLSFKLDVHRYSQLKEIIGRAKRAPHGGVQSIFRVIYTLNPLLSGHLGTRGCP